MKVTHEQKVFALANLFLSVMPDRHILRWSPEDYGPEVTDDHRTYCWNEIVDVYKMFPEQEIADLYEKHVTLGEDMSEDVAIELDLEEKLLAAIEEGSIAILNLTELANAATAEIKHREEPKLSRRSSEESSSGTDSRLLRLVKPELLN